MHLQLLAFAVQPHQLRDVLPIELRTCEAKLFLEGLLKVQNIAVLAKDKRNHNPVVTGPHLTVRAQVTHKAALFPTRNIGRIPGILAGPLMVGGSFVMNVAGCE